MRVTRLHVEAALAVGDRLVLPVSVTGHLLRVLRAGVGDACVLFNGDGCDYDTRIVAIGKHATQVDIVGVRERDNESPLRVTLLQSLARGEKMDWILQKATELGVAAIVPVDSERSEVKLDGDRAGKRVLHWRSVIIAACEQSGRARVPAMAAPGPLALALQALPPASQRLLLDPQAVQALVACGSGPGMEWVLAVGPEGGWSTRDLAALHAAGFEGARLGPRVLRTETAGVAAIAALQACFGDFA